MNQLANYSFQLWRRVGPWYECLHCSQLLKQQPKSQGRKTDSGKQYTHLRVGFGSILIVTK